VALYPWVLDIIGTALNSEANYSNLLYKPCKFGRSTSLNEWCTMRAYAKLLISSEVHEKCKNSLYLSKPSLLVSNLSFRKYSIALTSWLVVLSISLTLSASYKEKSENILSRNGCYSMINWMSLSLYVVIYSWNNLLNHSSSTKTLYFIKAYSEKYPLRSWDYLAYLPSIGEIAVRGFT
jgi:hypothetical protein